jgi:lysozyme family protein
MIVNIGYPNGVKVLQRATNAKGKDKLLVDGKIGPKTIAAVKRSRLEPDRLAAYRILYYAKLCQRKPTLYKYYYGWYRRTIEV